MAITRQSFKFKKSLSGMPMLVNEFNVQVFANGRIHWDNLDKFIPVGALKPQQVISHFGRFRRTARRS